MAMNFAQYRAPAAPDMMGALRLDQEKKFQEEQADQLRKQQQMEGLALAGKGAHSAGLLGTLGTSAVPATATAAVPGTGLLGAMGPVGWGVLGAAALSKLF